MDNISSLMSYVRLKINPAGHTAGFPVSVGNVSTVPAVPAVHSTAVYGTAVGSVAGSVAGSPVGSAVGSAAGDPGLSIDPLIDLAVSGLSANSRRAYASHMRRYVAWVGVGTSGGSAATDDLLSSILSRKSIKQYIQSLYLAGSTPPVRNQALAALKRLAAEAEAHGLIDSAVLNQITRIKSVKLTGTKSGIWLSAAQLIELFRSIPADPPIYSTRDRLVLALLAGCGLRRSEIADLTVAQWARVPGSNRTILKNIRGKYGRVRSVAIPLFVQKAIEQWIEAAQIDDIDSRLVRGIFQSGSVSGSVSGSLSVSSIRKIVAAAGKQIGIPALSPHDLRRTYARLAREAGAPLETIQHSLGHSSVRTTEIYTQTGLEANAGDWIDIGH